MTLKVDLDLSKVSGDIWHDAIFHENLTFTFSTGDSDVSVLGQMMEYTGRCVTVSEPNSPNVVATKYRKFGDSPELRLLARDVIRWECRPYPTIQPPPLGYVVKFITFSAVGLPLFRQRHLLIVSPHLRLTLHSLCNSVIFHNKYYITFTAYARRQQYSRIIQYSNKNKIQH